MSKPFLEVGNLRKQYGDQVALDGVSFQLREGEMFGLLGPNGAGKTTLLSLISCLLDATSGEVRLAGQVLSQRNREQRRQIGIVPQELALYGELTGRENLRFFGELYGLESTTLRRRVEEVLKAIGLEDRANQRVDSFSGGMKRRLNLGAALVHEPRLLLLDEPTTGVDPQSRNHIFEEIRRVNQLGVTVVYTSHYMEEVQALCTRIGIIDHGRLIACDTVPGLLRHIAGVIRFHAAGHAAVLGDRLRQLPSVHLIQQNGQGIEVECDDVNRTLVRLVTLLNELQLELTSLEMVEPNLERVFLHLTGRALRD
ncbi:MAG TPA: ABC transporter ATP-binding protein [Gemmataceae bacterium]|jgi:ABC-2 type transport system ATP-binding protein|nr:ABC transporter ATP-binding protein [Gemmataceae bacterium]